MPSRRALSLAALVAANAIPVFGVLALRWDASWVLASYWLETCVVGAYNVLKLLKIGATQLGKIAFFVIHFGLFTAGHGLFVYLFMRVSESGASLLGREAAIAALGFAASHGVSFALNFLGAREYETRSFDQQLVQPYARILFMHAALILGMFLLFVFHGSFGAVLVLVAAKTFADVRGHLKEHNAQSVS